MAVFVVFLALVLLSAALEVFVVVKIISAGEVDALKGAVVAINGTGLAALLAAFIKLVRRQFVAGDMVSEDHLLDYFKGRLRSIDGVVSLADASRRKQLATELVRECLRLAESVLRGWIGNYHFELSVFENADEPVIVAYYDSGGGLEPRSKPQRDANPNYYREHGYEVVELLSNPGNNVHALPNTRKGEHDYSFANEEQRRRIGSTVLHCFCNDGPRALVIACDRAKVLKKDRRIETLVRAVGTAMHGEYAHDTLLGGSA